jgi:hypothetical protein
MHSFIDSLKSLVVSRYIVFFEVFLNVDRRSFPFLFLSKALLVTFIAKVVE